MKRESCFTLVELLITVSVIIILLSLLLPGLNKARAKADSAACTGNLKQIGLMVAQYANDFDDFLVSTNVPRVTNSANRATWYEAYSFFTDQYYKKWVSSEYEEYKKAKKSVYICPSAVAYEGKIRTTPSGIPYTNGSDPEKMVNYASYIMSFYAGTYSNNGDFGSGGTPILKLSALKAPSQFSYIMDSSVGTAKSYIQQTFDGAVNPHSASCRVHYRHLLQTNVLSAGGNVRTVRKVSLLDIASMTDRNN